MSEYLERYKSLVCVYAAKIKMAANCLNSIAVIWAIGAVIAFGKEHNFCFSVLYALLSFGLFIALCFGWHYGLSSNDIKKSEDFLKKMYDGHCNIKNEYGDIRSEYTKTIGRMNYCVCAALIISVALAALVIANRICLRI